MLRLCIALFFIFSSVLLFSQESETSFFPTSEKNERFDAGAPIFSVMLLPVYSPEMGFSLEATGVVTYKTRRNNPYLWHSASPISFGINPEGSFKINFRHESYWFDNLIFIGIETDYRKMKDNYWGVGIEKANEIEKDESTTEYDRKSYYLHPVALIRVAGNLFTGLSSEIARIKAINPANLMLEDPEILTYGTDIFSAGLGIVAFYNRRNNQYPTSYGLSVKAEGIGYYKKLGSDYQYQQLTFDYRHFIPVIRKGSLLALQLKTSWCIGDVPWTAMPQPGGSSDLRGYYQGQYRDRAALILLAEYRHFFMHPGTESVSRHGFVYWLGGGTVFHKIVKINKAILNTGLGYRYRLQPGITLRIDIGFGTENVGIYLGLNESF